MIDEAIRKSLQENPFPQNDLNGKTGLEEPGRSADVEDADMEIVEDSDQSRPGSARAARKRYT